MGYGSKEGSIIFPETYLYKEYDSTDTTAEYARRAAIDKYSGTYSVLETTPTYNETGVIYAQKGLKQV